jgi:hypothetical protein
MFMQRVEGLRCHDNGWTDFCLSYSSRCMFLVFVCISQLRTILLMSTRESLLSCHHYQPRHAFERSISTHEVHMRSALHAS